MAEGGGRGRGGDVGCVLGGCETWLIHEGCWCARNI